MRVVIPFSHQSSGPVNRNTLTTNIHFKKPEEQPTRFELVVNGASSSRFLAVRRPRGSSRRARSSLPKCRGSVSSLLLPVRPRRR
jgi:hypothetical protein